ncbi:phosphatase PAP2 family protein [Sinosporangium album]|uniref:phosphatase PAP2 family protein n=1 Tax=Sinosporangium album TaxID=504805 RepID=UPI001FDF7EE1|nr:phosphatase PAP2 family protein [Sinosporangium album]
MEFAGGLPSWVHVLAEIGTDAGLVLFAVIFLLNWWLARGGDPRRMALALVGPVAVVGAYIVSEVTKTLIQQDRPCWSMAVATIAECPAAGDWSFPSNHATIAAGAAGALMVVWRPSRYFALPLAAGMAFSRVFVGVHYPHDVLVGFLIGAILAPILTLLLVGAVTPLIKVMRNKRILHQLI